MCRDHYCQTYLFELENLQNPIRTRNRYETSATRFSREKIKPLVGNIHCGLSHKDKKGKITETFQYDLILKATI